MGKKKKGKAARVNNAIHWRDKIIKTCDRFRARLVVSNFNQHWRVISKESVIQWWPSTGKIYHSSLGKGLPPVLEPDGFIRFLYAMLGDFNGVEAETMATKATQVGEVPAMRKEEAARELCALQCLL